MYSTFLFIYTFFFIDAFKMFYFFPVEKKQFLLKIFYFYFYSFI